MTSTTAATSATRATTNNQIAPIIRHYTVMNFTEHDQVRTNENWRNLFAASAGNKLAKDTIKTLHYMLQGVVNVSALSHLYDAAANPMTVQTIRQAKRLLGDQGHLVDTLLLHSDVWSDLMYDLTYTYKYSGNMSGQWLANGYFDSIFGVKNIIVSDDLVAIASASSVYSGDVYYSWLLKSQPNIEANEEDLGGPIYHGYQAAPRYSEWTDVRVPSDLTWAKWKTDYCLGVRGMAFSGGTTGSPTTADLLNSSLWTVACSDTRMVGVIGIKSQGGQH